MPPNRLELSGTSTTWMAFISWGTLLESMFDIVFEYNGLQGMKSIVEKQKGESLINGRGQDTSCGDALCVGDSEVNAEMVTINRSLRKPLFLHDPSMSTTHEWMLSVQFTLDLLRDIGWCSAKGLERECNIDYTGSWL